MTRPRLILIGMMGSGKTTVGRLLAAKTGWPYVDNDTVLAQRSGASATEISAEGEAAVRTAEADALRHELATPEPCVVGVAAGTILDSANRSLIAGAGLVIWLRARPQTLAARASRGPNRPWLQSDPLGWFQKATAERQSLYAKLADLIVDVDDLSAAEAARRIFDQPLVKALTDSGSAPSAH